MANSEENYTKKEKILTIKLKRIQIETNKIDIQNKRFVRKLKNEYLTTRNKNISLQAALEDQQRIGQTWYKDLLTVKTSLQETNEKLLNLQLAYDGNYELAVESEAGRRLKTISEPLEVAVGCSLDTVLGLVKSLTQIKMLVGSLIRLEPKPKTLSISKDSLSNSSRSRPPLSKVNKSRRRHVVHPMVKGHVFQPATITLPRVSMLGRSTYRLLQPQRITPRPPVPKTTTDTEEVNNERVSDIEEPQTESMETTHESEGTSATESPQGTVNDDLSQEAHSDNNQDLSQKQGKRISKRKSIKLQKEQVKKMKVSSKNTSKDDPLEGPSWLYTDEGHVKGQNKSQLIAKIRKYRTKPSRELPYEHRVTIDSSTDSETEIEKPIKKAAKKSKAFPMKNIHSKRKMSLDFSSGSSCKKKEQKLSCSPTLFTSAKGKRQTRRSMKGDEVAKISNSTDGQGPLPEPLTELIVNDCGKENIPPNTVPCQVKLKKVQLVVKDCMKDLDTSPTSERVTKRRGGRPSRSPRLSCNQCTDSSTTNNKSDSEKSEHLFEYFEIVEPKSDLVEIPSDHSEDPLAEVYELD